MTDFIRLGNEKLVSILLNHMYPDGNVNYLMVYARRLLDHGGEVAIDIDLPDGHWAFTHAKDPGPVFYVTWDQDEPEVMHRILEISIGKFPLRHDAVDYAEFLNKRLESKSPS